MFSQWLWTDLDLSFRARDAIASQKLLYSFHSAWHLSPHRYHRRWSHDLSSLWILDSTTWNERSRFGTITIRRWPNGIENQVMQLLRTRQQVRNSWITEVFIPVGHHRAFVISRILARVLSSIQICKLLLTNIFVSIRMRHLKLDLVCEYVFDHYHSFYLRYLNVTRVENHAHKSSLSTPFSEIKHKIDGMSQCGNNNPDTEQEYSLART